MSTPIKTLSELGQNINFEVKYPEPKRGEIYQVDLLDIALGTIHITSKSRPSIIISNDVGNRFSPTVIVALLSTAQKKEFPMHYTFNLNGNISTIMFEQILTIDKNRLINKVGELSQEQMIEAEQRLMSSLELNRFSLNNVKDIDIVNTTNVRTKTEKYISFGIEILFQGDLKKEISIKLSKLQEFDKSIDENIEFEDLRNKLDCIKGLNWLVNNNDI